jgi:hypothetical protein
MRLLSSLRVKRRGGQRGKTMPKPPSDRQAFALAHPLNRADGDIAPYRAVRKHATGMLVMTILAVDR